MIKNSYPCTFLLFFASTKVQSANENIPLIFEVIGVYKNYYKHYLNQEFKDFFEALENVAHANTEYHAASKKFSSTHMQPNPANEGGLSDAAIQANEDYEVILRYCIHNPSMRDRFLDQLKKILNVSKEAQLFALENLPNIDSKEDQELYFDAKRKLEDAFERIHAFEKRYTKYIPSNNTIVFNEREVNSFKSICDYKSIIQTCRNFNKSFEREFKNGVFIYCLMKYLITRCFSRKLNEYSNENTIKFENIKKYLLLKDEFSKILTTGNLLLNHAIQNETKILNMDFCIFKEMIYDILNVEYTSPDNFRPTPEFINAAKNFQIFKEKILKIIQEADDFHSMRDALVKTRSHFFLLKEKIDDIQVSESHIRSKINFYLSSYESLLNRAIFLSNVITENFKIANKKQIAQQGRSNWKEKIKNCCSYYLVD